MLNKEIDGLQVEISKLDLFESFDLDRDIQDLAPVILSGLDEAQISVLGDLKKKKAPKGKTPKEEGFGLDDLMDLDLSKVADGVGKIINLIPRETYKELVTRAFKCVVVVAGSGQRTQLVTPEAIQTCGLSVVGSYKLLLAVMEENGFIPFVLLTPGSLMWKTISSQGVGSTTTNS